MMQTLIVLSKIAPEIIENKYNTFSFDNWSSFIKIAPRSLNNYDIKYKDFSLSISNNGFYYLTTDIRYEDVDYKQISYNPMDRHVTILPKNPIDPPHQFYRDNPDGDEFRTMVERAKEQGDRDVITLSKLIYVPGQEEW